MMHFFSWMPETGGALNQLEVNTVLLQTYLGA